MSSAPPGWHRVPGTNQERYWDGNVWTDAYRAAPTSMLPPGHSGAGTGPGGYSAGPPHYQGSYPVGGGPAGGGPAGGGWPAMAPTDGQAVASMVLGIVSLVIWIFGFITGIIGLVLGANALKNCQPRGPNRGRGMAIAGITCSIIALGLWTLILIALASSS